MPENLSPSRESAQRIGRHLKRSYSSYIDSWQEWILPTLIAGFIFVCSMFCCIVPYLFVIGPLSCGFYACAFASLRNQPVEVKLLTNGLKRFGSKMLASVFITSMLAIPFALMPLLMFIFMGVMFTLTPPPSERLAPQETQDVAAGEEVGESLVQGEEVDDTHDMPFERNESSLLVFFMFPMMMGMYLLMFLGIVLAWIWQLWFATRTIFVYPLLLEQDIGCVEAIRRSWKVSGERFWELLMITVAVTVLAMLGAQLMYIGLLVTMPIASTLIASAYQEHFETGIFANNDVVNEGGAGQDVKSPVQDDSEESSAATS
ncbi:MAG: hypothetical protein ACI9G1_001959 [Pirellulaceae bacterium]|jgi:hypothetical protein